MTVIATMPNTVARARIIATTMTSATTAATGSAMTTITAPTAMPETAAAIIAASGFATTTSMATRVLNAVAMNYCYNIDNSDRSSNYIRNDGNSKQQPKIFSELWEIATRTTATTTNFAFSFQGRFINLCPTCKMTDD